jgi:hypothetical protein
MDNYKRAAHTRQNVHKHHCASGVAAVTGSCVSVIYIGVCTEYQNSAIKLYVCCAGVSALQIIVYSRDITIYAAQSRMLLLLSVLAVVVARLFVLTVSLHHR